MVDQEIRAIIKNFINDLIVKGIRVEKAVLYGSYATRKVRPDSDIDIAIISPDFGQDRFNEGKLLMQIAWRIDPRIQPIPISSESYKKDTWLPLIYEIRKRGIEISS